MTQPAWQNRRDELALLSTSELRLLEESLRLERLQEEDSDDSTDPFSVMFYGVQDGSDEWYVRQILLERGEK